MISCSDTLFFVFVYFVFDTFLQHMGLAQQQKNKRPCGHRHRALTVVMSKITTSIHYTWPYPIFTSAMYIIHQEIADRLVTLC